MLSSLGPGKRAIPAYCARSVGRSNSTFSTKSTPFDPPPTPRTSTQTATPTPSTSKHLTNEEQTFYQKLIRLAADAPSLGTARGQKLREKGWTEQQPRRRATNSSNLNRSRPRSLSSLAGASRSLSSSSASLKARKPRPSPFESPLLRSSVVRTSAIDSDLQPLSTPRPWHPSLPEYARLTPGCYVDVRRAGISLSGIYLGPSADGALGRDHLVLEANGAFSGVLPEDVMFILPFAERSLAQRAAADGVQSDSARSLWLLMRRFEFAAEVVTRGVIEKGAHELYARLDKQTKELTTGQAAKLLRLGGKSGEATLMEHLVLHRLMVDANEQFIVDPVDHRSTGTFTVRPKAELDELTTVRDWVRLNTAELDTFVREAVAAIKFAKKPRLSQANGPDTVAAPFEWSPTSIRLIDFLKKASGAERNIQPQPYLTISPSILKAVDRALNPAKEVKQEETLTSTSIAGPERVTTTGVQQVAENDMSREAVLRLLVQIGVVAPWENWVAHEGTFLANWEKEECSKEKISSSRPRKEVLDKLDSVRHDFGSLAVYTIDDVGALELDDGVSIESLASGSYWVHAHIADPTSLISPNSPMALLAQSRNQTEYFPEQTWAMLPHSFIEGEKLSLGSQEGKEHQTLTISTRIDGRGDVQESVVRAGVVRNVKRLTYGAVDRLLGDERSEPRKSLVHPVPTLSLNGLMASEVGKTRTTDDGDLLTDATAKADLTELHALASQLLQRRLDNDALFWNMPRANPSVTGNVGHHFNIPAAPTFYNSAPIVSLPLISPNDKAVSPAQLLVSEVMVLANRSAARFAVERGISLPFVSQPEPDAPRDKIERVLAKRDPLTGEAKGADVLRERIEFTSSELGLEPKPHWPMGIRDEFGYTRVTSPLRRYGDLLGHWQLKSALLPGGGKPAFDKTQVGQAIATMRETHLRRGRAGRHASAFWASYLLREKSLLSPGEDPLADQALGSLSAIALREPIHSIGDGRWLQQVLVMEVGVMGQLWLGKEAEGMEVGEVAGVGVERVVVGHRSRLLLRRRK